MTKWTKRQSLLHLKKCIRKNIKFIKEQEQGIFTDDEIESTMRWCAWIHTDCRKYLKLKRGVDIFNQILDKD